MANPGGSFGSGKKLGTRVSLETTITGAGDLDYELRDNSQLLFPEEGQEPIEWGIAAGGFPAALDENHTLSRTNADATLELPFTHIGHAIATTALFQHQEYSAPAPSGLEWYPLANWQDIARYFAHVQGGSNLSSENSISQGIGGVASSVSYDIPASDNDRGKPMIRASMLFANADHQTSYGNTAGMSVDTERPAVSDDFTVEVDSTGIKYHAMNWTVVNNAQKGGNVGATPDLISIGKVGLTGVLSVLRTAGSGDIFMSLRDAAKALTTVRLRASGSGVTWEFDALLSTPKTVLAGGIYVAQIPFKLSVLGSTSIVVASVGADISQWTDS